MNEKPIVAVDFFCGAGGMTNGLIRSNIHVLAGIDNQPRCEKTYRQNVNKDRSKPEFLCFDVFKRTREYPQGEQHVISSEIERLLKEYRSRNSVRSVKLVFSICAPCQPFTSITRIKMSDQRIRARKNDTNLLLATLPFIRQFRPDSIIIENVEGMFRENDESSVLLGFSRALRRNGYIFTAKTVNAAKFGVPQNRKRTIGIGIDRWKYGDLKFDVPESAANFKEFVTVREMIGELPAIAAGEAHPKIPNHRARELSPVNLKRIACAPPGGSNEYLRTTRYGDLSLNCHSEEKGKKVGFRDTYTRMSPDAVGPTITTKAYSISNGRFGHFDTRQNRGITPREAALLQTFPLRYVFHPEDNLEFTMLLIGNAVPPRLAKHIGKFVCRLIT